jgi:hypothetical protein
MDLSFIVNPPSVTDAEAAQILSSMSTTKEICYETVYQKIVWKLSPPPPVTYIGKPVQEESSAPPVTKTYPRRIRRKPSLSIPRFKPPKRTKKPPLFKRPREIRIRENPLGFCHYCRGLYVMKHMERHQETCDGTLRWCRYDPQSIEDYSIENGAEY